LDVLFCILFRYWPLGLDRAAEVRWLSTRRRLRIATRRPPRQPLLTSKLRCAGDRLEVACSVEKLENAPAAFSAKLSRGRQFAV
jgi:hypothetical protein